jgi:hypothetical protein
MAKDDTQKKLLKVKPRPATVVIPSSSMEPTEPIEESIEASKSWFQRILDSKFATAIFKLSDKAGKKWEKFEDTKLGKAFTIGTGVAVSRVASIVLASLTIAGLVSPASPAVAIAIGVIGLTTVAIGVIMDTARTRATRQLQKENQLLVKNRTAKSIQDQIFKLDPSLNEILKDELYQPITTGKKSVKKRYIRERSATIEVAKDVGKAFFKQGLNIVSTVLEAVTTKGVNIVKAVGSFILSLATESRHNMSIRTVQKQFKTQIDQERDKRDTPGYNNFKDLRQATRSQRIQTMALQKLITDKNYWTMSPEEKKAKFQEYREQINQTEKAVSIPTNIFTRGAKKLKSLVKDARRAHNPFSEFNYPGKIRIDQHSSLTAAMDAQSKKEKLVMTVNSIRENLSLNTLQSSKKTEYIAPKRNSTLHKENDKHL